MTAFFIWLINFRVIQFLKKHVAPHLIHVKQSGQLSLYTIQFVPLR